MQRTPDNGLRKSDKSELHDAWEQQSVPLDSIHEIFKILTPKRDGLDGTSPITRTCWLIYVSPHVRLPLLDFSVRACETVGFQWRL